MARLPPPDQAGAMTERPPGPAAEQATSDRPPTDDPGTAFDRLRRLDLRRSPDGWIGGVCAGLARRLGVDPLAIRAGAILLSFVFGLGVLLYLLAWALIPDTSEQTHAEKGLKDGAGGSITLLVVTALVALGSLPWFGWSDGGFNVGGGGFAFGLLALVVSAVLLYALWSAWQGRSPAGAVSGRNGQMTYAAPPSPRSADPAGAPPPPAPDGPAPGPVQPVTKRRRSGGAPAALVATGLLLATVAGVLWVHPGLGIGGNPLTIALAAGLTVLGGILLGLGVTARRAGFVGFLAGITLLLTLAAAPLPEDLDPTFPSSADRVTWTPVSPQDGTTYELGAGEAVLDLRQVDPALWAGETLDVSVAAGELRILAPDDVSALISRDVGMGALVTDDRFGSTSSNGFGSVEDSSAFGSGPPDLEVEASVGLGRIVLVTP